MLEIFFKCIFYKIFRPNPKSFLERLFLINFKIGIKTILHKQMTEKLAFKVGPKNRQKTAKKIKMILFTTFKKFWKDLVRLTIGLHEAWQST